MSGIINFQRPLFIGGRFYMSLSFCHLNRSNIADVAVIIQLEILVFRK